MVFSEPGSVMILESFSSSRDSFPFTLRWHGSAKVAVETSYLGEELL
jgi:hypothetical protein